MRLQVALLLFTLCSWGFQSTGRTRVLWKKRTWSLWEDREPRGLLEDLGNLLLCELVGVRFALGREGAVICMDGAGVGTFGVFSKHFFDGASVYRHNFPRIDSLYILLCHGSLLKILFVILTTLYAMLVLLQSCAFITISF